MVVQGSHLGFAWSNLATSIPDSGAGTIADGYSTLDNFIGDIRIPGTSEGGYYQVSFADNNDTLSIIDTTIKNLNARLAIIAAKQSYFKTQFDYLDEFNLSMKSIKSNYEDLDISQASSVFTANSLQIQSAGQMLTQSNAQKNFVLNLLP